MSASFNFKKASEKYLDEVLGPDDERIVVEPGDPNDLKEYIPEEKPEEEPEEEFTEEPKTDPFEGEPQDDDENAENEDYVM
ncbi:hypothetical protein O9G_004088 [Rozella allomycis CSF55]|uniref:Uncharacterized protein n=1 Tax=Rozella allomycis (strain CSF55) TaxID=988480 RepID=A0A075AXP2_ROZAC|nr:hypothetical protein O9G_004088 [Rozella allomycis CSF55]|eukprot:EPZ35070.1 hypothetical protein O9G_004088 [Rozella allomycis CSF55]